MAVATNVGVVIFSTLATQYEHTMKFPDKFQNKQINKKSNK